MGMKPCSRRGVEPPRVKEATSPSGEQVELSHGDQRAVVVGVGGGLRGYWLGDAPVLDGYGARRAVQLRARPDARAVAEPDPGRLATSSRAVPSSLRSTSPSGGTRFTASSAGRSGRSSSGRTTAPRSSTASTRARAIRSRSIFASSTRWSEEGLTVRVRGDERGTPRRARTGSARIRTSPPATGSWTSWSSAFRRAPHSSPTSARSPSTGSRWRDRARLPGAESRSARCSSTTASRTWSETTTDAPASSSAAERRSGSTRAIRT